jgi:hypothetical protein
MAAAGDRGRALADHPQRGCHLCGERRSIAQRTARGVTAARRSPRRSAARQASSSAATRYRSSSPATRAHLDSKSSVRRSARAAEHARHAARRRRSSG